MPIATGLAIGLGVASAAAGVGTAAIGAHAAGKAADAQSQAAMYAADQQRQSAKEALDFQKQQYATSQANAAPWLTAGKNALGELTSNMAAGKYGDFTEKFQAPTGVTEQNDPGYQFRLQQGLKAIQNSAAARGGLYSGNTQRALNDYAQGTASNEYSNVYNRALGEYQQRYNIFEGNQANSFNRLAALSGVGQTTANQLSQSGQQAAGNVSNILLDSSRQIGQDYQNAGAARASGYIGAANAWNGAIGGATNNIMDLLLLRQLGGGAGIGASGSSAFNY